LFQLPQAFYNGLTVEQQCFWHKFIDAARNNKGDTATLKMMGPPSQEDVQQFKKRQADRKEHLKSRKKACKVKASPNASGTVAPYVSLHSLSINDLSSGEKAVPHWEKSLPTLRILMIKDPVVGPLPTSSISLAQ
jgi:hypothetical protein